MEATKQLHNVVIPQFAKWLDQQEERYIKSSFVNRVSEVLHENGISVRKLGYVRQGVTSPTGASIFNPNYLQTSCVLKLISYFQYSKKYSSE